MTIVPVRAQSPAPNEGRERRENTENWLQESQLLYERGDADGAIAILQIKITEFTTAGDILKAARANIYLSLTYQQKGEWEAAQNSLERSQKLLETLGSDCYPQIFAQFLEVRGKLYHSLGQHDNALNDWQQATQFYQQSQQNNAAFRCLIQQSLALRELGQYRAMLNLLLPQAQQIVDPNFPNTSLKVLALQNLAQVAALAGDRDNLEAAFGSFLPKWEGNQKRTEIEIAEWLLQDSLTIAQQLNLPQAKAESYLRLGELKRKAYRRAKDASERAQTLSSTLKVQNDLKDAAIANFQKARATATSPLTQIHAYLNLLNFLIEVEKRPEPQLNAAEARQQLNTLLPELEEVRSRLADLPLQSHTLQARINLATSLIKKEPDRYFSTIESLLLEAKAGAETLKDLRNRAYALGYLGKLYQTRSQLDRAFELTQKAILYSGEAKANEILYEWEWQQGKLYAERNNLKEAIVTYEETLKTLDGVRNELLSLKNPDVNFTFRDNVEPVYREYAALLFKQIDSVKSDKSQAELVQRDLDKARKNLEKLQLAELEDYLRCRIQQNNTLTLDEAIETKQLKAATLHVSVSGARINLIVKLPQQPELLYFPSERDRESLDKDIDQAKKEFSDDANWHEYTGLKSLYYIAIAPIKNILESSGVETLVFVLDNPLTGIPMSALYDGKNFLLEKYSIAVNLGLDYPESEPLVAESSPLLIAGISQKNEDSSALAGAGQFMNQMQAKTEWNVLLLRDEAFTGAALEKALAEQSFSLVHLVTHGQYSSSPEETFLLAWKEEKLNLFRIADYLKNRANSIKLLVLDACKTAVGDRRTVLGIAGVSIQAGARSTVASFANVPDESAPFLMEAFYRELRQPNVTKAEALRRAQLALWEKKPDYKQPKHWSPYILIGNWN